MHDLKKAWYRCFQMGLNIGSRVLYWRKPHVLSGMGCCREIPRLFQEAGINQVMVVTGRHVGKTLAPAITETLTAAGIRWVHYDAVESNPGSNTVYEIEALYRKQGCKGFLAIGGGSPIDAAKAAAALVAKPGKKLERLAGLFKVLKPLPFFVAVPTTAGTGSETTIAAVITDSRTHHKYALMDLCLVPRYAVLDPELIRNLPPKATATTGMDALTHAVEAYLCWTNRTREVDELAEKAAAAIFRYLERSYNDGNDVEAREQMMLASYRAGFAFTRSGVGNIHAIAHTLGGLYGTAHGLANAVILPIVLADYGEKIYPRLSKLARAADICVDGTEEEQAKAFIAEIRAMNRRMDLPSGFDFIQEKDIPQMIAWALAEANPTYPVPVIYDAVRCERVIRRIRAEAEQDTPVPISGE